MLCHSGAPGSHGYSGYPKNDRMALVVPTTSCHLGSPISFVFHWCLSFLGEANSSVHLHNQRVLLQACHHKNVWRYLEFVKLMSKTIVVALKLHSGIALKHSRMRCCMRWGNALMVREEIESRQGLGALSKKLVFIFCGAVSTAN